MCERNYSQELPNSEFLGKLNFYENLTNLNNFRENMPPEMVDISNHSSYFAEVLRANPELYAQLKLRV